MFKWELKILSISGLHSVWVVVEGKAMIQIQMNVKPASSLAWLTSSSDSSCSVSQAIMSFNILRLPNNVLEHCCFYCNTDDGLTHACNSADKYIYIYTHTHTHTQTYKCSFRKQNAKQDVVPWTPIELDCVYRLNALLVFFILYLPSFHSPLLPPSNFHCSLTNAMFVHEDLDMFYHGTRSLGFLCDELFVSRQTAPR